MSQPLNLALTLSLNDRLVGPLQRALGEATKVVDNFSRELLDVQKAGAGAADGLAKVGKQADGLRQASKEAGDLARQTREAERSASRLAGVWSQMRNVARGIGGVTAGATAFNAVVAAPVRRAADYDMQLRGLANTAYAGQDLDVRRWAVRNLDQAITGAVRFGGGSREGALDSLNELVASGAFSDPSDAAKLLPLLQRGSTASGASSVDLARIAIRGQQTFGIPAAQMGQVLDQAMAAGQAGGFELRDMAKWLPQQMAAARSLGLSGQAGLVQLLAANQASVITAGTKDEAGNNLVNLLAKVNSQDTAHDFQKLGIDLPGSLAAARGKGVDGLTAFVNMVDQIVAKDSRFQAARRGAAGAASDSDKRAAYEAQGDILQGSAIGKVIQDRQALMALVALMNNRQYVAEVTGKVKGSSGALNDAFSLMSEGAGFRFDQAKFERLNAETNAMNVANVAIAKLADAQTSLYQQYPGFSEGLHGAVVAVTAFSGALLASGIFNLATGGLAARSMGAAAGAAGAAGVGTAASAGVGAGMATAGRVGGVIGLIGGAASVAALNVIEANREAAIHFADDTGLAAAILNAGNEEPADYSNEGRNWARSTARERTEAANRALDVHIHVTTDSPAFTAEVMEQTARQATRQ